RKNSGRVLPRSGGVCRCKARQTVRSHVSNDYRGVRPYTNRPIPSWRGENAPGRRRRSCGGSGRETSQVRNRLPQRSLIRELVNIILIERKLEEYRHKLTRLGLPVNDVTLLLREAGQKQLDANWVQKSAGDRVIEEYVLLDSLPRATIDAHLAGHIHLED